MIQERKIYKSSLQLANTHYENFPVASLALPKSIRKHVAIIYQFARYADDLADEGDFSESERIAALDEYSTNLQSCIDGKNEDEFWKVLVKTINEMKLDGKYFFDLLSAFKQDVTKKRYSTFDEVLDYCKRSANPVGRLMLQLFGINDELAFHYSDSICTALQLTNFYQDVSIDYKKNRIYISQDELEKFGVSESSFAQKEHSKNFRELMKFQLERTHSLFKEGKQILNIIPKSFLIQMRMTIAGGETILGKIESIDYDVMNTRPILSKSNYFSIFMRSILPWQTNQKK